MYQVFRLDVNTDSAFTPFILWNKQLSVCEMCYYLKDKNLFFIIQAVSCELPGLSAFAMSQSSTLFVMCMNADL